MRLAAGMARAAHTNLRSILMLALMGTGSAGSLVGQASLDPTVAPRAAELARNGQRGIGTEMLSRYLATSPDDGSAWIQLGRFYLLDIRDWHLSGHPSDSPGALYIDFGAAALDQAVRLRGDSAVILRQMLEVERALDAVERQGYEALTRWTVPTDVAPLPDYISELGANLLSSCPATGVMATGNDLETVAIFSVVATAGAAGSVVIVVPAFYATDARYRHRIASALGTDSSWSVQQALATVAQHRPVCLTPHGRSRPPRAARPAPDALRARGGARRHLERPRRDGHRPRPRRPAGQVLLAPRGARRLHRRRRVQPAPLRRPAGAARRHADRRLPPLGFRPSGPPSAIPPRP